VSDFSHGTVIKSRLVSRCTKTLAITKIIFEEDGGLQSIPAGRYVLKSCHVIQIEVKFDTEDGVNHKPTPDENLKIIEVSRPYLQRMALD